MGRPRKMQKSDVDLVKSTINMQTELSALTVDKIAETPKTEVEPQTKLTTKQIAANENIQYIEPRKRIKGIGTLPEKLKKQHDHDWEYVKGIAENYEVVGEPICFWLSLYPGDPDCLWEIPVNRPVYVPRMIAKHLESVMEYHSFNYIEKPTTQWKTDEFTHNFAPSATHYRGKFRPIGAFS